MPITTVSSIRRPGRGALRLVKTQDLSREEWLSIRRRGIGSSDAAAAIGLNPHQSMLELWMIKTGRAHMLPQSDPHDRTSPTYWGSLLEPIVAAHYTHETGNKVRKINAVLQHPDPDKPWMLANIDREVLGAPDVQILECKTAGEYGARAWREGVPEYVQCQVQHQLAVTGKAAADVCVLSRALFETGSVSWKRSKEGTQLDAEKLETDHPTLVKAYLFPKAGSRRFLIQP